MAKSATPTFNGNVGTVPFTKAAMSVAIQTDPASLARLATHKAILEGHGITNLAGLGSLDLSATIIPQPGLVRAPFVPANGAQAAFTTADAAVQNALVIVAPAAKGGATTLKPFTGAARRLIGEPLVGSQDATVHSVLHAAAPAVPIPINTAYWVANTINFANDTTIVIQGNVRFLVIIANSIAVGSNVSLTYDHIPVVNPPSVPPKPSAPSNVPATPDSFSAGYSGDEGASGVATMQIGAPPNAPEVEMWTLDINAMPLVNLKGQPGYPGVRGGDGADGGRGGSGSESVPGYLQCKSGPGNGGLGGKGGRGGTGGAGGNGGMGGRWSLYTTGPMLTALSAHGFYIDVSGGNGGAGGAPGSPGNGGPGGYRGGIHGFCANQSWNDRHDGDTGPSGDAGNAGPAGALGVAAGPDAMKLVTIAASDFVSKLEDAAITQVNPSTTTVGSTITISGFRFTPTDEVRVGGVQTPLTFVADTMIQCVVPNTTGGLSHVQVSRSGNQRPSNIGTLFIQPVVTGTIPPSPAKRLRPGTIVTITGSGLSPQTVVRINNTDVANATFIDSQTVKFTMLRPGFLPYNPAASAGEPAYLSVAVSGPVMASNQIPIVIATFQMVCVGDSIMWGQGLQEPEKFYSLVAAHVKATNGGVSVFTTNKARTGAILGWYDLGSGPDRPGDLPDSYPTVKQQAEGLAALPNAPDVDLVLVCAGANDVKFSEFLDPHANRGRIQARVTEYCENNMTEFLTWLASKFTSATIVCAGYYAGLSLQSDPNFIVDLVGVQYGLENNKNLGAKALAISIGVSPAGKPTIAGNATFFATQANLAIATAVANANATINPARIFFADPRFKPENAAMAPKAWVYGLNDNGGILQPTDGPTSANQRKTECQARYPHLTKKDLNDREFCNLSSTGHPNVTGAQKYAEAIIALL